ncbi:sel1 repeat family protein [Puniceicoccaceae bacterium K14]|nr:sel1 repeat family protein [Puniceicoccaceae bacterium K14]
MIGPKRISILSTFLLLTFSVASTSLASLIEDGWTAYEQKDYAKAIEFFQSAADNEDRAGYYALSLIYGMGEGVAVDIEKSHKLLTKAAELELVDAQVDLAYDYLSGYEVDQDLASAIKWFKLAGEQEDPRALFELGHFHYHGTGVERISKKRFAFINPLPKKDRPTLNSLSDD